MYLFDISLEARRKGCRTIACDTQQRGRSVRLGAGGSSVLSCGGRFVFAGYLKKALIVGAGGLLGS